MKCCVVRDCKIKENNKQISLFEIPSDKIRSKMWLKALEKYADIDKILQARLTVVCQNHFSSDDWIQCNKRKKLKLTAVPSKFTNICPMLGSIGLPQTLATTYSSTSLPYQPTDSITFPGDSNLPLPQRSSDDFITISLQKYNDLVNNLNVLNLKLKKANECQTKLTKELNNYKDRFTSAESELQKVEKIKVDANNHFPAHFLYDQIINYGRCRYTWSENTIKRCLAWRYYFPKGYEFTRKDFLKLPSRSTLNEYLSSNSTNAVDFINNCLKAETELLKPIDM